MVEMIFYRRNIRWLWLFLSFVCVVFCYIQPIAIFALLWPTFFLLYYYEQFIVKRESSVPIGNQPSTKRLCNDRRCWEAVFGCLIIILGSVLAGYDYLYFASILVCAIFVPILFLVHHLYFRLVLLISSHNKKVNNNCNNNNSIENAIKSNNVIDFSIYSSLLYPIFMTSIYILINFTPMSSLLNPSYALYDWNDLIQLASIFGLNSITFLHYWLAVIILKFYILKHDCIGCEEQRQLQPSSLDNISSKESSGNKGSDNENDNDATTSSLSDDRSGQALSNDRKKKKQWKKPGKKQLKRETVIFGGIIMFSLVFGGIRLNCNHFWQIDQSEWDNGTKNVLNVACITRTNTLAQIKNDLYIQNGANIVPNLDFILLSEQFADDLELVGNKIISSSDKLEFIFNQVMTNITSLYNKSMYIGVGNDGDPYNNIQLFKMESNNSVQLIKKYLKGNPVPFIEDFPSRKESPMDTIKKLSFDDNNNNNNNNGKNKNGIKIAMEICFDLLFYDYSLIGSKKVDLMIHPSWLWGSFADTFVKLISFRSIENGYNILHCAHNGNAAFINQYGMIMFKQNTGQRVKKIAMFNIEVDDAVYTVYAHFGFVLEYILLTIGCLAMFLSILPKVVIEKVLNWVAQTRKACGNQRTLHRSQSTGPLVTHRDS